MNIRTISQLNRISNPDDITNKSLIELSLFNLETLNYSSNAVEVKTFTSKLSSDINENLKTVYGLTLNNVPIKSSDLSSTITNIISSDISFSGTKTFLQSPTVPPPVTLKSVTNKEYVDDKITDSPIYIKTNSILPNAFTIENIPIARSSDNLLHWELLNKISGGKVQSTEQVAKIDGNLVCYGWITPFDLVDPASAWVVLECFINGNWVIVQLMPWVVGNNSLEMQYISFNVPVKKGVKIRITSGFGVNYNKTTYQNRDNTLIYNVVATGTNITNAFVGYVIG